MRAAPKAKCQPCYKDDNAKRIFGDSENEHGKRKSKRDERTTPELQLRHFVHTYNKQMRSYVVTYLCNVKTTQLEQHLLRIRPISISSPYLSTYLSPRVRIGRNWTYDIQVCLR